MKRIYYVSVLVLSVISITLALLDISNVISINAYPYNYADKSILIFFWIDYLVRLFLSKDKKKFFKANVFDLFAIIPFDSIFYFFRAFRVLRVIKLLRLIRIVGFTGKIQKSIKRFFGTNGFIYLVITTIVLILIGAEIYSVAESVNYMNSLWWAIATTTTVGYGDISPHTEVGRFVAVALMILGIGLIGSVTSTVTAFFVDDKTDKDNDALKKELQDIKLELKKIRKEYRNSWPDHVVPVCFGGIVEVNTMAFISSNYNKYHKFVLRPPCLGCYYNRCVGILLCNWITRREKRTVIKYY